MQSNISDKSCTRSTAQDDSVLTIADPVVLVLARKPLCFLEMAYSKL
jgi:hypothetical protein